MGFLLAGIGIAILNKIYYYKNKNVELIKTESLFVIIPVVMVMQPFIIDGVSQAVSMVITIVIALILIYSVRKYLVFSKLSKEIKHLPIELLSTGMIYMILSMF